MRSHPRDALLQEIFRRSGKPVVERLLEHVEGCVRCRQRVAQLEEQARVVRLHPKREENYGPALDRAFEAFQRRQASLDRERSEAPALLSRLLGLIPERQRLLLGNSQRFQTWGLLELLIARGREETFTDPEHAEEILRLALDIAGRLPPSFYGSGLIEDMRARGWGYIANARRVRWDLIAAEEAFGEAFMHLEAGSEDPLERALLWDLEASFRRSQGETEVSLRLLGRATSIFRGTGERHLLGRTMVKQATLYSALRKPIQAASALYEALGLIDPSREPRLSLYALNNLVDDLVDAGRFAGARNVLMQIRPLYSQFQSSTMQIGYFFLEAKVAYGLGQPGAEQRLDDAINLLYRAEWPQMKAALREVEILKAGRRAAS
jgi:tetratricopeptide (TPR) repeat protein